MEKNYTLRAAMFAAAMLVGSASVGAQTYCTYEGTNLTSNRHLNSITISGGEAAFTIEGNFGQGSDIYQDRTGDVLTVKAGASLSTAVDYTGAQGYYTAMLYIDYNNDGEFVHKLTADFSGTPLPESELVTFSNVKGIDSDGKESSGSISALPTFSLPLSLANGSYRARFKVDCLGLLDPCGHPDSGQYRLTEYGGIILDFTINVEGGSAIGEVENDGVKVFAADGQVVIESEKAVTAQIFTTNGAAVKAPFVVTGYRAVDLPAGMYVVNVDGVAKLLVVK